MRPGPPPTRPSRPPPRWGELPAGLGYSALATAALAAGDVATALDACEAAAPHMSGLAGVAAIQRAFSAHAALADGDLIAARRRADEAVSMATRGRLVALPVRARIAIAQGEPDQAERDAHDGLGIAATPGRTCTSPTSWNASPLWPARMAVTAKRRGSSARQTAVRQRMGAVRFKV